MRIYCNTAAPRLRNVAGLSIGLAKNTHTCHNTLCLPYGNTAWDRSLTQFNIKGWKPLYTAMKYTLGTMLQLRNWYYLSSYQKLRKYVSQFRLFTLPRVWKTHRNIAKFAECNIENGNQSHTLVLSLCPPAQKRLIHALMQKRCVNIYSSGAYLLYPTSPNTPQNL